MHVIMPKRRDKADVVIHASVQRPPIKIDVVVIQFIKGNDNYNYKDTTTHPRYYQTHSTRADVYQQNEPLEEKTIADRLVALTRVTAFILVGEWSRSLHAVSISVTSRVCYTVTDSPIVDAGLTGTHAIALINYLVNYYVIGAVLCFDPVCSDLTCSSQVRYK